MYDTHDYLWGIAIYSLGGFLAMVFLYLYCRKIPWRHLRNLILLFFAVLIFTPVTAYPDKSFLAPAWFVTIYESFMVDEPDSFLRGLTPMLIAAFFALVVYLVINLVCWKMRRKQTTPDTDNSGLEESEEITPEHSSSEPSSQEQSSQELSSTELSPTELSPNEELEKP